MQGRRIRVRGQVQGVGFRPFVWQLARRMGLRGEVLNDPAGVLIHVCGPGLDRFEAALRAEAPPLARVDAVDSAPMDYDPPEGFSIAASAGAGNETRITPDAATCPECAAEIRDPAERRCGYAFSNCTHCGPRFTIIDALPYDRARTAMAVFAMCAACRAEYDDPADRRFHAQPIACPDCGPTLWLEGGDDGARRNPAAVRDILRAGGIVAIKGIGGFHLACDATSPTAIATLRARKNRPAKPLALMAGLSTIRAHAEISEAEEARLRDPAAPIVLLAKAGAALPDGLAPGQDTLGWMLPYTPLHHMLLRDWAEGPLVMTSGNLSGEPQVIDNAEARCKLAGIADAFLMHDRDIRRRLDDSVERVLPSGPMILRRARGRVPGTLPLPDGLADAPQVVAYGGQMKGAICLTKNGEALLGHHLGDMDDLLTIEAFDQADGDYADLFDHHPHAVACDLHPEFHASRHAAARAQALGVPLVEVQHHHAHLAACLADNGWPLDGGPVAGLILDGLGLGADGTIWGGEVLVGDYLGFERRAFLKPAPLVGGDRASVEPWRNALARLDQAGMAEWADALFAGKPLELARQAMDAGINAPLSSSAGRLFDAVAAVLGICPDRQSFEGEAAMRLEALARRAPREEARHGYVLPVAIDGAQDTDALFHGIRRDLDDGLDRAVIAYRFHAGLASFFAQQAARLLEAGEAKTIALSGGCFQNALLLEQTVRALGGLPCLVHTRTPANDGGLALGQAAIAAARMARAG